MSYTFKDLAAEVLANVTTPLSANEIWGKATELGFTSKLSSQGRTPIATLGADLRRDVVKENTRFIAIGRNPIRFKLKEPPREDFIGDILPEIPSVFNDALGATSPTPLHYTFLQCAEKVLKEVANRHPMHYREITRVARLRGWLQTDGQTPEETLRVQISSHIQRTKERGQTPIFTQVRSGCFGLTCWEESNVNQAIVRHNKEKKAKILENLKGKDPIEVENLVAKLMDKMGFEEIEQTPARNDRGIDVYGTWTIAEGLSHRYAVQVKRVKNNIERSLIQKLRGSLRGGELGIFVTTSDFSKGAREDAKDKTKGPPISLINGTQLVEFLVRYNILGHRQNVELLVLNEESAE